MNEDDLKKYLFSETVKIISALATKNGGYNVAISLFNRVYDDLMTQAIEKGLSKK